MEELARLEEQLSILCEAQDALEGTIQELDLGHIKELTAALTRLKEIQLEIEEFDMPQAKEAAAKEAEAELAELHSTYRWQQGF